jgi:hypothetical protein
MHMVVLSFRAPEIIWPVQALNVLRRSYCEPLPGSAQLCNMPACLQLMGEDGAFVRVADADSHARHCCLHMRFNARPGITSSSVRSSSSLDLTRLRHCHTSLPSPHQRPHASERRGDALPTAVGALPPALPDTDRAHYCVVESPAMVLRQWAALVLDWHAPPNDLLSCTRHSCADVCPEPAMASYCAMRQTRGRLAEGLLLALHICAAMPCAQPVQIGSSKPVQTSQRTAWEPVHSEHVGQCALCMHALESMQA